MKSIYLKLGEAKNLIHVDAVDCNETVDDNIPRSQGPQTLLMFWWTKYVQSSSISVYSDRMQAR